MTRIFQVLIKSDCWELATVLFPLCLYVRPEHEVISLAHY